jgi:hypothetical protein
MKPAKGDELEEFLASMDDPESLRLVYHIISRKTKECDEWKGGPTIF